MNRGKILESWRKKVADGTSLKGGPDGPDFVVVSSRDSLRGMPAAALAQMLPIGDSNALSLAAVQARVPTSGGIPVLAGVCATDPLRMMENFLQEIQATGAAGVQNRPSVGLIDGTFRKTIEDSRLGYVREIEMIGLAAKLDLVTAALVFTPEDARKMAEAGADLVVAHPGFAEPREAASRASEIAAAARSARKNILVLGLGSSSDGLDGIQIDS